MDTQITYLDHSGFMVRQENVLMVFDYYRDPTHALHKELEKYPLLDVVFLVSHHHPDHFNNDIFNMAQSHKRLYILSNDIYSKEVKDNLPVAWMSRGDRIENVLGGLTVEAFGSTDAGVSYLVTTASGTTVFHAGDLNNWQWSNDMTRGEQQMMSSQFTHILNRISQASPVIDIAFFPVDSRLGQNYALGAQEFMKAVKVKYFFPMHFGRGAQKEKACDFGDYGKDAIAGGTRMTCLDRNGDRIKVDIAVPQEA